MKKGIHIFILLAFAGTFLTSCVAKKKYVAANARTAEVRKENVAMSGKIVNLEDTISSLHHRLGALGNANEVANNELNQTTSQLNMTKEQIEAQRQRLEAQRARLNQLQTFIDQQQMASENLRKNIAEALTSFNSSELAVTMKNGRVYISMQEALLFPSGSAKVNPRGKEALSKVAAVLNKNTDVSIDIEGHTDDVPIHTAQYPDNWSLSTARATSIAHVLIDEYAVVPTKLTASGRSQYDPLAANTSAEGRAQNRRTEIILEPRYEELMNIMNGNTAKK